jgi:hypothetical protein
MADEITPIPIEPVQDKKILYFMVGALGITLFTVVAGAIVLPFFGKEIAPELLAYIPMIVGGFLGALRLPTGGK